MFNKLKIGVFSSFFLVLSAVAATVYYLEVDFDYEMVDWVNIEIKTELNKDVDKWESGDEVVVTSTAKAGSAIYTYAPLSGIHVLTSVNDHIDNRECTDFFCRQEFLP
ncbi:hypothetical protein [Microbulbifer sp.]|uniref:hypothetical protein n=1 Tax=Microbulbifer sp. TaxID=1908541 RepID=UPI00258E7431|nr:hypothetical protein [Microbulbifer sp.]